MQIAIFFEGLLIIGLLIALLVRGRTVVMRGDGTSNVSDTLTEDLWNVTYELEERFQQNPIVKMNNGKGEPENLRLAFEEAAEIAFETAEKIREQNFYAVPPALETYCSNASEWYFAATKNYAAWAAALEQADQDADKGSTGAVLKRAIKGGIRGYLGGWLEVLSMLQEDSERESETPLDRHIAALQSERDQLIYRRAYLNSERLSVQNLLKAMFGWKFESTDG